MYIMNILYKLYALLNNLLVYVRVYVPILIDDYETWRVKMRKQKYPYN